MLSKKLIGLGVLVGAFAANTAMAALIPVDPDKGPYPTDNSGIKTEIGLINSAFGVNLSNYAWAKVEGTNVASSYINVGSTDTASDGSIAYTINWQDILKNAKDKDKGNVGTGVFDGAPSYFLLKFGVGGGANAADTFVFRNDAPLSALTFSRLQIDNIAIGSLSHITVVDVPGGGGGTGGNPVPEPATLALLGAGMAGLMLRRRRR